MVVRGCQESLFQPTKRKGIHMKQKIEEIKREIQKVIIGKGEIVDKVLMAILAGGHVLLEDVPGVGKTTMALSFAKTLGLEAKRVQFTSDSVPSDIIGFSVYDKNKGDFVYKPGAVMTNVLLADEINRTSSKTQSALLEAMEERHVTVDGQTYSLPEPFIVLATQNPVGSAGTQRLPNSQLDRFLIRMSMGYPDIHSQVTILMNRQISNPLDDVQPVVTIDELRGFIQSAQATYMDEKAYEYAATLVEATRHHPMVQLGISPRGALALCRMAKAFAFVSGKEYVLPSHIVEVFEDVCAHRLILNSRARMAEQTETDVLKEIVEQVEMPELAKQ